MTLHKSEAGPIVSFADFTRTSVPEEYDLPQGISSTLIIYEPGFNQNYYRITLILLVKIVMWSEFP